MTLLIAQLLPALLLATVVAVIATATADTDTALRLLQHWPTRKRLHNRLAVHSCLDAAPCACCFTLCTLCTSVRLLLLTAVLCTTITITTATTAALGQCQRQCLWGTCMYCLSY
jgi:hypothetical protein